VFQSTKGALFLINDEIQHKPGAMVVPGDNVLALVDADGESCIPDPSLFEIANLRVLLILSPRSRKHRKWLIQDVRDEDAVFIVQSWSREEFLVASFVYSA
jgi:hypothetical protein